MRSSPSPQHPSELALPSSRRSGILAITRSPSAPRDVAVVYSGGDCRSRRSPRSLAEGNAHVLTGRPTPPRGAWGWTDCTRRPTKGGPEDGYLLYVRPSPTAGGARHSHGRQRTAGALYAAGCSAQQRRKQETRRGDKDCVVLRASTPPHSLVHVVWSREAIRKERRTELEQPQRIPHRQLGWCCTPVGKNHDAPDSVMARKSPSEAVVATLEATRCARAHFAGPCVGQLALPWLWTNYLAVDAQDVGA